MQQSEKYYLFFHLGRLDGDACQAICYVYFHQCWGAADPAQPSALSAAQPKAIQAAKKQVLPSEALSPPTAWFPDSTQWSSC